MASTSCRPRRNLPFHLALALLLVGSPACVEALDARWAHTMVLLPSGPTLLISSGKTVSPDGQTYTSSPTSSTFDSLPLNSSFALTSSAALSSTSSPALTESISGAAPPYAWGNMEILSTGDAWSFGGDGSPTTAVQTGEDSVWLRDSTGGSFTQQDSGWGGEPMRRVGAASCTLGTNTYLTAGTKGDGSNLGILTTYSFSSTTSTFTLLPSILPLDLVQPSLHCLPNSTLLLLGGYSYTTSTLPSLATAYTLDTTNANAEWVTVKLGGDAVPEGRRAHLGTTFGSGNGVFVQGGGKGLNGLEEVLSDAWVLDVAAGSWIAVEPTGTGPGGRLGHQGVAIGASQVLFFGGYETTSAADANLYLYDLGTNAYLDKFTPPSTWSNSGSSSSPTAATTATTGDASSPQTFVPIVFTSTQTIFSLIPTATTLDESGNTQTNYLTSTIFSEIVQTTSTLQSATDSSPSATISPASGATGAASESYTPFDPATYTGILPGLATKTKAKTTATSKTSSEAGGSSDNNQSAGVPLSTSSKLAIGFGVVVGSLAIAAAATGLFLLRRKNSRYNEAGWAAGEKRGRGDGEGRGLVRDDDDEEGGGGWSNRRERKRMRFGAGIGAFAAGVFAAGAGAGIGGRGEKSRQARVDMLGDEDTRQFETYPPRRSPSLGEDGEEPPSRAGEHGGWANDAWNRSQTFVGSLIGRRDVSGGSGMGREWSGLDGGDLGEGAGLHGAEDEAESLLNVRGPNGGESPLIDDPFSDDNAFNHPSEDAIVAPLAPFPSSKLNAPKTALPRSAAMTSFYNTVPYAPPLSDSTHSLSSDSHNYPISSSSHEHSSDNATRGEAGYVYYASVSRSNSILGGGGFFKKFGMLKVKSPPPPSGPRSMSVMGPRMHAIRDPQTPPALTSLDNEWLTKPTLLGMGHQQETSINSSRSARTATSEQIERFAQMDIIQRNRTTSGTSASTFGPSIANTTPGHTPELGSEGKTFDFQRNPSTSSSLRYENPFEDHQQASPPSPTTPDLIALSPPMNSPSSWQTSTTTLRPPANPTLSTPSSYSSPSPTLLPTAPAPARRSVRDTVAAFEQHATSTAPLTVVKKHGKSKKVDYVAVPRARLGIANPDDRRL